MPIVGCLYTFLLLLPFLHKERKGLHSARPGLNRCHYRYLRLDRVVGTRPGPETGNGVTYCGSLSYERAELRGVSRPNSAHIPGNGKFGVESAGAAVGGYGFASFPQLIESLGTRPARAIDPPPSPESTPDNADSRGLALGRCSEPPGLRATLAGLGAPPVAPLAGPRSRDGARAGASARFPCWPLAVAAGLRGATGPGRAGTAPEPRARARLGPALRM